MTVTQQPPTPPEEVSPERAVITAERVTSKRKGRGAEVTSGVLGVLERTLGLTTLGVGFVLATVALVVVARLLPSRPMTLLGYGLVLIIAISWFLGRRQLALTASRSDMPGRVTAHRPVQVELTLEAQRRISAIVVEEVLDPQLGAPVRVAVPLLTVGQNESHSYVFTAGTRGIYQVGPTVAEFSDPFGLTRRRQQIAEPRSLIVHPRTEPAVDRIISRAWEDPPVRPPVSRAWPTGYEFYGMRDYQEGDDPRRIVWRALAQHDKYVIRESEQGITDRICLYLDTDVSRHSRGLPSTTFESAVSVVASLAGKHLADGFTVSIDRNSAPVATKAWRGSMNNITMLDAMAAVAMEKQPLSTALDRLVTSPDRAAHNVLVTPYLSQESAARLRLHLNRGGHLLLVLIVDDDTEALTLHRAGGLRCNVVEVRAGQPLAAVFNRVVGARR